MANNCYNYARITGPKDSLDKIEAAIEKASNGESLWWESFKNVFEGFEVAFGEDTYEEFGTKWFDCDMERESDEDLIMSGDSAWSPISPFLLKLSKYFNVTIESDYQEQGMDFAGWFECYNGIVTRDDQTSYIVFREKNDPGSAVEIIIDNIKDDVYESYEDWFMSEDIELVSMLTVKDLREIRNEFERRNDPLV